MARPGSFYTGTSCLRTICSYVEVPLATVNGQELALVTLRWYGKGFTGGADDDDNDQNDDDDDDDEMTMMMMTME